MTTKSDTFNYAADPLGSPSYSTVTGAGLQSSTSGAKGTSITVQDNVSMYAPGSYMF